MNQRTARALGKKSGIESGKYGDFKPNELADEDEFTTACAEMLSNKRQYVGDWTQTLARQPNSETLFDAYDEGESIGIREAWRIRKREAKLKPQTPNNTEKL